MTCVTNERVYLVMAHLYQRRLIRRRAIRRPLLQMRMNVAQEKITLFGTGVGGRPSTNILRFRFVSGGGRVPAPLSNAADQLQFVVDGVERFK